MHRKGKNKKEEEIRLPGVHYDPFDDERSHFHCDARIIPSFVSSPFSPIVNTLIRDTEDVFENRNRHN